MISPRWRKVIRDLWHNKTRTILVVLSIAIGVYAVGMILHTNLLVAGEVQRDYIESHPAHATIYAEDVDDEMLQVIRNMPGIAEAEGRSSMSIRLKMGDDEWRSMRVRAIPDFDDIRIDRIFPVERFDDFPEIGAEAGIWPPGDKEIAVERSSFFQGTLMPQNVAVGDSVVLKTVTDKERVLQLSGLTHESNSEPATFRGEAIGYVTFDTFEWLGGERSYRTIRLQVSEKSDNEEHILAVATEVESKIKKSGKKVWATEIHTPGKTPRDQLLQAFTGVMFVLGIASLILSGFLVVNTINALLSQHVRQIGVMKAIGAQSGQITAMYFVLVLSFGLLGFLIAVPLAALTTLQTAKLLASFLNVTFPSYTVPLPVLGAEAFVGIIVPVLAAIYPILRGTRVTVREALSDFGAAGSRFGAGLIDRVLMRIHGISRPTLVSIRNTFRRRGRLIMTLVTLILGGATFISVANVRESLNLTLDEALQYWQYDIEMSFARSYRVEQIESIALSQPGVVSVESWDFNILRHQRPDETESEDVIVVALPAATEMLKPKLIKGRWLLPGDENAIVVNTEVLKNEPDVTLGGHIKFDIDDKETLWQVVGVVSVIGTEQWGYVNYPYYTRSNAFVGRAGSLRIITEQHEADVVQAVADRLEEAYEVAGLQVSGNEIIAEIREQNKFYFGIIVTLLLIMSVLIAAVGALGLAGTMSINVLERTREIGVMRAIGASNRAVRDIVLTEGMLIGLLSWLAGALLSFPLGKLMSDGVGYAFFSIPLSYAFSVSGILFWLLIVLFLSAIAGFLPARSASRLTVRETLAYE